MKKQNITLTKARISQLTENRINMRDLRLNESLNLTEKKKKLDPVDAKELEGDWEDRLDADIDNDGDEDESDKYLHNRRKAIKKAMKKEEKECDCDMEDDDEHDEDCPMYKMKKESVELDEAAPKLKGDWLKKEREKNREHDAAMGRTPTGRKKPVRQMTSTQRSLASMRKEEVELDEAKINEAVNVRAIQKAVDDGKSMDVIMTMFANKRTTNTDEIRKVVRDYMWKKRMKKESVKLDESIDEATIDYKVNVEGLPPMFIDAKNPGEVKMKLRKLLRRPDSIGDVTRITKADLKKYFRIKGMGKDPEAVE